MSNLFALVHCERSTIYVVFTNLCTRCSKCVDVCPKNAVQVP
ncbi:MAG: 4Fe-4S binding protein [Promethearchaeota archaeon]